MKASFTRYQEHRRRKGADRIKVIDWRDVEEAFVLDLGCNGGMLSIEAVKRGAQHVYGVDIKPDNIRVAQEAADMLKLDNVIFEVQDVDDPDWQASLLDYDVVFFCATVRGLKDRDRAMRLVDRVAKSVLYFETNRVRPVFPRKKYERLLEENTNFRKVRKIGGYERGYFMYRCER